MEEAPCGHREIACLAREPLPPTPSWQPPEEKDLPNQNSLPLPGLKHLSSVTRKFLSRRDRRQAWGAGLRLALLQPLLPSSTPGVLGHRPPRVTGENDPNCVHNTVSGLPARPRFFVPPCYHQESKEGPRTWSAQVGRHLRASPHVALSSVEGRAELLPWVRPAGCPQAGSLLRGCRAEARSLPGVGGSHAGGLFGPHLCVDTGKYLLPRSVPAAAKAWTAGKTAELAWPVAVRPRVCQRREGMSPQNA